MRRTESERVDDLTPLGATAKQHPEFLTPNSHRLGHRQNTINGNNLLGCLVKQMKSL